MKRNLLSVLSFFVITVLIFSCKKYEEGPSFTLLTKKQRLAGEWNLKSIDDDQTLSISSYGDSVYTNCGTYVPFQNTTDYTYYILEFEKDGDVEWNYALSTSMVDYWSTQSSCTAIYNVSTQSGVTKGDWDWEDKKEDIEITLNNIRVEYEILKLTKEELKLETITGVVWEFEKD
ncbi:MAG TPA: hypothetical protein EYN71_01140 [Flavobacteriales bacterium]|nr:hypothetical protein [Flavobacteriales bacterium]HIO68849.1 hypothetical protein [Flavobacteriales bacterium]